MPALHNQHVYCGGGHPVVDKGVEVLVIAVLVSELVTDLRVVFSVVSVGVAVLAVVDSIDGGRPDAIDKNVEDVEDE